MGPILVINDSPEFLQLMHDFLTDEGFAVELLASGDDVLARVEAARPCLIVLDLVLGAVDGWVVLTQLRADERTRHLPVILCTAASERVKPFEATLCETGTRVLEKPFDLDHMLEMIRESLAPAQEPAPRLVPEPQPLLAPDRAATQPA